jgi:hypothetical protein
MTAPIIHTIVRGRLFAAAALMLFICTFECAAQNTTGTDAMEEYRYLIDMPTAGVLNKSFVSVTNNILPGGIVISRIEAGVFDGLSIGIGYGGANIIGTGAPKWYDLPSAMLRVRLMDEDLIYPSLTVGFDSQGKGDYYDSLKRYAIKSPGVFVSSYKSFAMMGYLLVHAAVNYSFESGDGDNFVNLQVGAEKTISSKVSLVGEYNFGLNDNTNTLGEGKGYLNIGVRWAPAEGFILGLDLRDMLNNKSWSPGVADRALIVEFIKRI